MNIPRGKDNITSISFVYIDRIYEDEKNVIFMEFNNGDDCSKAVYVGNHPINELFELLQIGLVQKQPVGLDPFSMVWCLASEVNVDNLL